MLVSSPRSRSTCLSCKRLKRKCSKELPRCSLCERVGRTCGYGSMPVVPVSSPSQPSNHDLRTSSDARSRSTRDGSFCNLRDGGDSEASFGLVSQHLTPAPDLAACFLDSVATRGATDILPSNMHLRDLNPTIKAMPPNEALYTAALFFSTIHEWLPIGQSHVVEETSKEFVI